MIGSGSSCVKPGPWREGRTMAIVGSLIDMSSPKAAADALELKPVIISIKQNSVISTGIRYSNSAFPLCIGNT